MCIAAPMPMSRHAVHIRGTPVRAQRRHERVVVERRQLFETARVDDVGGEAAVCPGSSCSKPAARWCAYGVSRPGSIEMTRLGYGVAGSGASRWRVPRSRSSWERAHQRPHAIASVDPLGDPRDARHQIVEIDAGSRGPSSSARPSDPRRSPDAARCCSHPGKRVRPLYIPAPGS